MKSQERQKKYIIIHILHIITSIHTQDYAVSCKVLKKDMKNCHRMGGKLDKKWDSPYKIVE